MSAGALGIFYSLLAFNELTHIAFLASLVFVLGAILLLGE